MQAAISDGDKQALSQAALELLRQLTRMQEHAKVQSQSPAEGLAAPPSGATTPAGAACQTCQARAFLMSEHHLRPL